MNYCACTSDIAKPSGSSKSATTKKSFKTEDKVPPPHEPGVLPKWLSDQNVDLVIAGGMGMRAQQLFAQAGVKVLTGAPGENPEKIVEAYLANTLETGKNVCDH